MFKSGFHDSFYCNIKVIQVVLRAVYTGDFISDFVGNFIAAKLHKISSMFEIAAIWLQFYHRLSPLLKTPVVYTGDFWLQ